MKKAIGSVGSWFAKVDGVQIACIHKHWLTELNYHDPFEAFSGPVPQNKITDYINSIISTKQAILTDDVPLRNNSGQVCGFKRKSYIAVYSVDDVQYNDQNGLKLRLTKRIHNLL